jgi:hypothetical protein
VSTTGTPAPKKHADLELLLDVLQERQAGARVVCKARLPQPHTCGRDALCAERRGAAFELVHQLVHVIVVYAAIGRTTIARQLGCELVQLTARVLKVQLHHLKVCK